MRLLQIYLEVNEIWIQHLNSLFLEGRLMNIDFIVMEGGSE